MPPQPSDDIPQVDLSDDEASRGSSDLSQSPMSQARALNLGDRLASDTAALPYLRAFFEEAIDAMAIADDSGHYVDANRAAGDAGICR
ncbi:MAG: hypothetical protein Fur0046_29590 [Cyanobacteria bacterium J069]